VLQRRPKSAPGPPCYTRCVWQRTSAQAGEPADGRSGGPLAVPAVWSRARRRVSRTAKGSVGNCPSAQGRWVRVGCPLAQGTKSRRFTRCAPLLRTTGMQRRATRCIRVRRNGTHWDSTASWLALRLTSALEAENLFPRRQLLSFGLSPGRVTPSLCPLSKQALSRNPEFCVQALDHSQRQCAPAAEHLVYAVLAPDHRLQILDRQA
jgi:hypothetical protein